MDPAPSSDFQQYLKHSREIIEESNWILLRDEFSEEDTNDLVSTFGELKFIFDLLFSMIVFDENQTTVTINGKKIINLNGYDLGSIVHASLFEIRDSIQSSIQLLDDLRVQYFFPMFKSEIVIKIQKQFQNIDLSTKELYTQFESYEMIMI
ncbi:hypothetical protein EHQ43_11715 [Leptospira bouyouniensis]|uniref:Uncharacterized protein n=1 Tax=Leptospira bouyouniensis TaxID=2484911 RepID=A0A7I0IKL3_9LEPT|nr:hypothetical protein [Leptospira bouyouniensis]TGL04065.1 hypothetical protein EHQ43_11715 [Leptospira bouyouniensis]